MKKNIFFFFLLLGSQFCGAQESSFAPVVKINLSSAATYTGLNSYLAASVQIGDHEIYAGPKLAMSKSYMPFDNVWGYDFGYNYYLLRNKHFTGLVNLDYQAIFFSPYTGYNEPILGKNATHEFLFSLGICYYPGAGQRFGISLNCGTGFFLDKYYDEVEMQKSITSGRAEIVRLGINYRIFGK